MHEKFKVPLRGVKIDLKEERGVCFLNGTK